MLCRIGLKEAGTPDSLIRSAPKGNAILPVMPAFSRGGALCVGVFRKPAHFIIALILYYSTFFPLLQEVFQKKLRPRHFDAVGVPFYSSVGFVVSIERNSFGVLPVARLKQVAK